MIGQIIKMLFVSFLITLFYVLARIIKLILIPLIKVTFIITMYIFIVFFYYANKLIIIILSVLLKGLTKMQTFIYNKYLIMYANKGDEQEWMFSECFG